MPDAQGVGANTRCRSSTLNLYGTRSNLCRSCRVPLTDSIRAHLASCTFLSVPVVEATAGGPQVGVHAVRPGCYTPPLRAGTRAHVEEARRGGSKGSRASHEAPGITCEGSTIRPTRTWRLRRVLSLGHSITWSARSSSHWGMVRPRAWPSAGTYRAAAKHRGRCGQPSNAFVSARVAESDKPAPVGVVKKQPAKVCHARVPQRDPGGDHLYGAVSPVASAADR